jgi:hypothetical protein
MGLANTKVQGSGRQTDWSLTNAAGGNTLALVLFFSGSILPFFQREEKEGGKKKTEAKGASQRGTSRSTTNTTAQSNPAHIC